MTVTVWLLIGFCLLALILHAASIAAVWIRSRCPAPVVGRRGRGETVSVIRPVCGLEDVEQMTLASSFQLTWPETELLFCVAAAADPAVPFLERLIAAHAGANARILIGDNSETANPKLNNLIKGWQAAKGEWIILAQQFAAAARLCRTTAGAFYLGYRPGVCTTDWLCTTRLLGGGR